MLSLRDKEIITRKEDYGKGIRKSARLGLKMAGVGSGESEDTKMIWSS